MAGAGRMTIELHDITKVYQTGGGDLPVLKGISFSIPEGELCAIMGPSGSGKSTLMNIIGCLDTPTAGSYCSTAKWRKWTRRAGANAEPEDRLRLPGLQLIAHHGARERGVADPLRQRTARAAARGEGALQAWARATGWTTNRTSCPAANSSAWRLLVRREPPTLILADEPTGNLDPERRWRSWRSSGS